MSARTSGYPSGREVRATIYARYSSENQREASIDDQVRICRARAEREGWDVVACFTDAATSGSTVLRPGYQALLGAMRGGRIEVVLAESLDRFSRDQEHVAAFFKQARFAGVQVVTLAEGEISELHVGLKGTMGAIYLKDLADKTRRGLEGRVREGRSGGGLCYVAIGRDYLACPTAERRGPCENRARVRRGPLEARVLAALGSELMQPELVASFVTEFTAEWNRLQAQASAGLAGKRAELERVRAQLERLVDALAEGAPVSTVRARIEALEARQAAIEAEVRAAGTVGELPRLHGNLAQVYRERVVRLQEALAADGGPEIVEAIRALIDRVEVHPPLGGARTPRTELLGHLASMLRAAGLGCAPNARSPLAVANGLDVFLSSESGDAGTRIGLCRTRLR